MEATPRAVRQSCCGSRRMATDFDSAKRRPSLFATAGATARHPHGVSDARRIFEECVVALCHGTPLGCPRCVLFACPSSDMELPGSCSPVSRRSDRYSLALLSRHHGVRYVGLLACKEADQLVTIASGSDGDYGYPNLLRCV